MAKRIDGVYTITCKVNGRQYVGSAAQVRTRWGTHRGLLRRGVHPNPHLQADWTEHGEAAFEFRTIAEIRDRELRLDAEQAYLDRLMAGGNAYNVHPNARDRTGARLTDEQRAALSLALKGRPTSAEHRTALSDAGKRRYAPVKGTPEIREQMAAMGKRNLGKPKTAEHARNIALAQRSLTDDQIREIQGRLAAGEKGTRLAPEYKVHQTTISNIKRGKLRPADEAA